MRYTLKKGLDLPLNGEVSSSQTTTKSTKTVAITGDDYKGMKPTMLVNEGDKVLKGQPVFTCKKSDGLVFTSPVSGEVKAVNRGDKRVFQSLVIEDDGQDQQIELKSYKGADVQSYSLDEKKTLLMESGIWPSLRQRPFDRVAHFEGTPSSLFINAADSNPLAPQPTYLINKNEAEFYTGVQFLSELTEGKTYVCGGESLKLYSSDDSFEFAQFTGPHPSGNSGTHIHFLDPVINANKVVWHIGYQDVIALGKLLTTGQIYNKRTVALVGANMKNPQMVETTMGACISELLEGQIESGTRVISGSVLHGRQQSQAFDFLGHYHNQITAITEDNSRELLGWLSPGFNKFSTKNIYLSKLLPTKKFNLGSSTHGSPRAMVPTGNFESIMPMDILPTQLLRALASGDTEGAIELGCLELGEEDLALCTFVAPGKVDFGPMLRNTLDYIEKEG